MQSKAQLTAAYAQAVKDLPTDDNWRENRAALGRQFVADLERLTRREREESAVLITVGSGKPVEKIRGIRI